MDRSLKASPTMKSYFFTLFITYQRPSALNECTRVRSMPSCSRATFVTQGSISTTSTVMSGYLASRYRGSVYPPPPTNRNSFRLSVPLGPLLRQATSSS